MNTNKNIGVIVLVLAIIIIVAAIYHARSTAPSITPTPPSTTPPVTLPPATQAQTYSNSQESVTLNLPNGYTVDSAYTYQELGPGKDINGIKFTIPAALATGTNLGSDSYISVENIPKITTLKCVATLFLDGGINMKPVTDNGVTYSYATSNGAAAGNRYDETVYAFESGTSCMAIRSYIHYSVFENYPPGTVTQFDEASIVSQFDAIRHTIVVNQ